LVWAGAVDGGLHNGTGDVVGGGAGESGTGSKGVGGIAAKEASSCAKEVSESSKGMTGSVEFKKTGFEGGAGSRHWEVSDCPETE
jgi:hypothetical protein